MLRAICGRPRTAREFTNAQHDALSPKCLRQPSERTGQARADRGQRGRLVRSHRGRPKHNSQPSTPPRTFCNATTTGRTPGRPGTQGGADRAAAIPSRGRDAERLRRSLRRKSTPRGLATGLRRHGCRNVPLIFKNTSLKSGFCKGRIGVFADTGPQVRPDAGRYCRKRHSAHQQARPDSHTLAVAFQFIDEANRICVHDIGHSKDGKLNRQDRCMQLRAVALC